MARLGKGVSGVLAALLLVLIVTSSMATVMVLTGRSMEHSRATLEESARRARDTATPPALSLEASGGSLVATVVSQNPTEVKWFIVERADGSVEVKPGGRVQGATRFTLLTGYNCQPVRVYMLLASGVAVAYDPRNDPLIARMPEGWDGWWTCGLAEGLGGGGGVYDPRVWLEARGLGGGGNDTVTIPVNWNGGVSTRVRVGASIRDFITRGDAITWGECSILDPATQQWYPEVVVGSFTVQGSRVDVVLGCAQGWPIALYLALRGPEDTVFSGRVDFSYSVTFVTGVPPFVGGRAPDPSLEGPLPVAYTPIGHSSYIARSEWRTEEQWLDGRFRFITRWFYQGSATVNYRMSAITVLLVWAYLRPDPIMYDTIFWPPDYYFYYTRERPYENMNVSITVRVDSATRVKVEPTVLDLGASDVVRVKLYRYSLAPPQVVMTNELVINRTVSRECPRVFIGYQAVNVCVEVVHEFVIPQVMRRVDVPEPFNHAVYRVYQSLLPGAPRVYVVASVNGVEFGRPVEPGKVAEVAFPGARFRVEATPHVHPPLFNGIMTSYRDVSDRVREYSGGTHPAPSLSPWRGPALVEIETPKSRFLVATSWPGVLAVTQLNTTYRGYAQLVAGQPFTVTPDEMMRIASARVDGGTLVVAVEQTVFANPPPGRPPDLRGYAGTHIVITVAARDPYHSESIIVWVN